MEKLKVFTAFSGYDSQCMALERLKENFPEFDYELVGWAEIDKPAIASHNAVFPQWADRNYGDISKIDWSQVPDFDLFTYSSPCFVAGTKVHTRNGYKNIEDIQIGDEVISHTGNYRKVVNKMSHDYTGMFIVEIKTPNGEIIQCTPNHRFYVLEKDDSTPSWKEISRLCKGDKLCIIKNDSSADEWFEVEHYELIKTTCDVKVYNMTVDIDNSYNVYDVIVHNCQDFSICGTQKGGFEGTQTRSSLLWECQRTIEEKRPKFLLLENVKALYEDHIFKPLLFAWKKTVDNYGYVSDIRVLNSSDYDIPQGRERVFMVSIRKDLNEPMYIWPKEMPKTREITDFLNKKVSEEYYADDKDFPKFYDLLVNAGEWFDETTKENKHLVKQGERVIKRRRYTIGENENKTEGALF